MQPQIEFSHVLVELSVNRNDPCEILRELISNSYDAKARNIFYAPLQDRNGFVFLDDGAGLSTTEKKNGITPWEAFFSIGKSTKKKGEDIGYKCQGSKLCFACQRILVATTANKQEGWNFIVIENPRSNLNVDVNISPKQSANIEVTLADFYKSASSSSSDALSALSSQLGAISENSGTLIAIDQLETESFTKYFATSVELSSTYLYNYMRFYSCHGDIRSIKKDQGFSATQIHQISKNIYQASLFIYDGSEFQAVEFGFPYLATQADPNIKSPAQISRLRDGRFFCRAAKAFYVGQSKFSIVLAVDGNKRAHDEYRNLDRRGAIKSGVKLADQRGSFVSVKGIKICKYFDIFLSIPGYEILAQGDSYTNYTFIIDGDFDLVTNRNSLSKRAFDTLIDPSFVAEIEKFLATTLKNEKVFSELLARLKRESNENLLNEQMEILERSRARLKKRERFYLKDLAGQEQLFLSPLPGEEYLVGVLYATLGGLIPEDNPYASFWKKILTFSTQGIDSLALSNPQASSPLMDANIDAVEYKYEFTNGGPFNHSLAIVDMIVAWSVQISDGKGVKDSYTCSGNLAKDADLDFVWHIDGIETDDGARFKQTINVICLRDLIRATFPQVVFRPQAEDVDSA